MPRAPFFASPQALASALTAIFAFALGCGDSGPSSSGTASSSAGTSGDTASSATTTSSGSGGASSSSGSAAGGASGSASSSGAGGSGGGASASNSGASASSSAGSGSSTGSGMSGGLGAPCASSADCNAPPPDSVLYCNKPGCGAGSGTCALQPTSQLSLSQAQAPVCGCDHVTYWNADYAAFHGTSVAAQGACAGGMAIACDAITTCPGTMKCNRSVATHPQCSPSAPGTCWSMPVSCPVGGPSAQACSDGSCQSVCDLIQSQNPWWNDASCP